MKLRNKKTGEVATLTLSTNGEDMIIMGNDMLAHITNLSELKDYEDYEEPKEYWYLENNGEVIKTTYEGNLYEEKMKEIGNYFGTKEEAEKAVEKLKAWKRLKDRNFRFNLNYSTDGADINHKDVIICRIEAYFDDKWEEENMKAEEDLDLLLGDEE